MKNAFFCAFFCALSLFEGHLTAQTPCGCTFCDQPILNNEAFNFVVHVDGAVQNDLASANQGLCGVRVRFSHDFLPELSLRLISPAGQWVDLVQNTVQTDTTWFSNWNIQFLPCAQPAVPDANHPGIFSGDPTWGRFGNFTGQYHPAYGCLEDFNLGAVNSDWTLEVIDHVTNKPWAGYLFDLELVFCDMEGIQCAIGSASPPTPSESCADAPVFSLLDSYVGNTSGYAPNGAAVFCGTLDNDQWISFVAASSYVYIQALAGNCANNNGVQLALYEDCQAAPIACNFGNSGGAGIPVSISTSVTPGQQYYLVVDGYAADQCSFELEVSPVQTGALAQTQVPQGPAGVCLAGTKIYSIPNAYGAHGYIWKIMGNGTFPDGSQELIDYSPNPVPVEVSWGLGAGSLCVAAYNVYDTTAFACLQVLIDTVDQIALPPVFLCSNEVPWVSPYPLPAIDSSGVYTWTVPGNFCDTLFSLAVTVSAEPSDIYLPPVLLLLGQCFYLPTGEAICAPGIYTRETINPSGCVTTTHIRINSLYFILPGSACAPLSIPFLSSGPDTAQFIWSFPGGMPPVYFGGAPEVLYDSAGLYGFSVSMGSTTLDFPSNIVVQDVPVAAFTYSQNGSTVQTFDQSTGLPVNFTWNFGDGTIVLGPNQIHDFPSEGVYTVQLIVSNACGIDTTSVEMVYLMPAATALEASQVRLYPNPVSEEVTVESVQGVELKMVTLWDARGRAIWAKNVENCGAKSQYSLQDLPSGLYWLEVKTGLNNLIFKVQKISN